jgi:hypothetical protein
MEFYTFIKFFFVSSLVKSFFCRVMSRMENSQENGVDGKQAVTDGQFECRLLIPSKMAGSIIGMIVTR